MEKMEIETVVLQTLYEAYFQGDSHSNMHEIRKSGGWNETTFWNVADRLEHEGHIEAAALGGFYEIKPVGILIAEKRGIVPKQLQEQNETERTVIMDSLATLHENEGSLASMDFRVLATESSFDADNVLRNTLILEDLGYIESAESGAFTITQQGLRAVEEWRSRKGLQDEFDNVATLDPHPRGRALQKLVAKAIEPSGWSQEEGVKTSNEEMDVVVFRDREYYLVECKWEKNPIEADVVREVYGKLANRIDVRGIVASMSGFTGGAKGQSESYANQRVILLFGPEDVRSMIRGDVSFEDLLNAKYRELIIRRNAVFA